MFVHGHDQLKLDATNVINLDNELGKYRAPVYEGHEFHESKGEYTVYASQEHPRALAIGSQIAASTPVDPVVERSVPTETRQPRYQSESTPTAAAAEEIVDGQGVAISPQSPNVHATSSANSIIQPGHQSQQTPIHTKIGERNDLFFCCKTDSAKEPDELQQSVESRLSHLK